MRRRSRQNRQRFAGFSMVELIVVIAIMGVLMVVLAPQYLKYVERSRLQKDNTAIGEIAESIKASCSNDNVSAWIMNQPRPIELKMVGTGGNDKVLEAPFATPSNPLEEELSEILAAGFHTSSAEYRRLNKDIVFSIDVDKGAYMVTVIGVIEDVGKPDTSKVF